MNPGYPSEYPVVSKLQHNRWNLLSLDFCRINNPLALSQQTGRFFFWQVAFLMKEDKFSFQIKFLLSLYKNFQILCVAGKLHTNTCIFFFHLLICNKNLSISPFSPSLCLITRIRIALPEETYFRKCTFHIPALTGVMVIKNYYFTFLWW
jgi:hypothetical protein